MECRNFRKRTTLVDYGQIWQLSFVTTESLSIQMQDKNATFLKKKQQKKNPPKKPQTTTKTQTPPPNLICRSTVLSSTNFPTKRSQETECN